MDGHRFQYKGALGAEDGFLRRRRVGSAGREKYLKVAGRFRYVCAERRLAGATSSFCRDGLPLAAGSKQQAAGSRHSLYLALSVGTLQKQSDFTRNVFSQNLRTQTFGF